MRIEGVIWLEQVVDKLAAKHRVSMDEVEEALSARTMAPKERKAYARK